MLSKVRLSPITLRFSQSEVEDVACAEWFRACFLLHVLLYSFHAVVQIPLYIFFGQSWLQCMSCACVNLALIAIRVQQQHRGLIRPRLPRALPILAEAFKPLLYSTIGYLAWLGTPSSWWSDDGRTAHPVLIPSFGSHEGISLVDTFVLSLLSVFDGLISGSCGFSIGLKGTFSLVLVTTLMAGALAAKHEITAALHPAASAAVGAAPIPPKARIVSACLCGSALGLLCMHFAEYKHRRDLLGRLKHLARVEQLEVERDRAKYDFALLLHGQSQAHAHTSQAHEEQAPLLLARAQSPSNETSNSQVNDADARISNAANDDEMTSSVLQSDDGSSSSASAAASSFVRRWASAREAEIEQQRHLEMIADLEREWGVGGEELSVD